MGKNHAVVKSPKEKAEAKARQLAGLRKGKSTLTHGGTPIAPQQSEFERTKPPITIAHARTFAKLLAAGITAWDALGYIFPPFSGTRPVMAKAQHGTWVNEWLTSAVVVQAITELNGGEWHELPHERQIELALDHLDAQMARFLYTADYGDPGAPIAKIADARNALLARLKASDGDEGGFERMMREMIEGKLKDGPPQLAPPKMGIPVLTTKDRES